VGGGGGGEAAALWEEEEEVARRVQPGGGGGGMREEEAAPVCGGKTGKGGRVWGGGAVRYIYDILVEFEPPDREIDGPRQLG
jgi:hypothetical protein